MKSLKHHLFLVLAIVSILFSIEVYFIFTKIVKTYEQKIANNYNIIVVSKTKIETINSPFVKSISQIDITQNLEKLKSQLNNFDIDKLKKSLPYFYQLHLKKFPNPDELKELETTLKSNPNIKRIESFKTTQIQTYNLLLIIKMMSKIFMILILIISFLLIIKQLEVSKYEHSQRIYIMELFGAPFWFKSAILFKIAIIDSILSILIMTFMMFYIQNSEIYLNLLHQLNISIQLSIGYDLLLFTLISIVISLVATFIVVLSKKDRPL